MLVGPFLRENENCVEINEFYFWYHRYSYLIKWTGFTVGFFLFHAGTYIIFYDLYLLLIDPFKPVRSHYKWYWLVVIVFVASGFGTNHFFEDDQTGTWRWIMIGVSVLVNLSIGFFMCSALSVMAKQGINKDLRRRIKCRYVSLFILTLV